MAYKPIPVSFEKIPVKLPCSSCVLDEKPCPIADALILHCDDATENELATKILGTLVDFEGRCQMFSLYPTLFADKYNKQGYQ